MCSKAGTKRIWKIFLKVGITEVKDKPRRTKITFKLAQKNIKCVSW